MNIERIENKAIGETYYSFTSRGLRVLVAPKKLSSAYAVLGVDFGSADIFYEEGGKRRTLPLGIAHFLEHKMFEREDGSDAFEQFSLNGANANAYTGASKTCYMFACTDNFESNLSLLLETVTVPHFTDESVDKERLIINKEIQMYKDDPYWQLHFSLLNALYYGEGIKADPAGTEETVAAITANDLYNLHRLFYTAENMLLCICGDVDVDTVRRVVESVQFGTNRKTAKLLKEAEPHGVCTRRVNGKAELAVPLFAIGIKCDELPFGDERIQACAENEIILQLVFGKSGDFYNRCYESGLIGDRFAADYCGERGVTYIMLSGSSSNPDAVYNAVLDEIAERKKTFCTAEEFDRAKKVCYASALDSFGWTESTASALLSFAFDGGDALGYTEKLRNADIDKTAKRFAETYDADRMAFSVIYNKEENIK